MSAHEPSSSDSDCTGVDDLLPLIGAFSCDRREPIRCAGKERRREINELSTSRGCASATIFCFRDGDDPSGLSSALALARFPGVPLACEKSTAEVDAGRCPLAAKMSGECIPYANCRLGSCSGLCVAPLGKGCINGSETSRIGFVSGDKPCGLDRAPAPWDSRRRRSCWAFMLTGNKARGDVTLFVWPGRRP